MAASQIKTVAGLIQKINMDSEDTTMNTKPEILTIKRFCLLLLSFGAMSVSAEDAPVRTLFTNVHVFDGVHEERIENANVLIEDNLIAAVSSEPIESSGATVIDAGGRTMIPGLTDMHWHMALAELPMETIMFGGDAYEVGIRMAHAAPRTLMRGFTTVRDMGGNTFSLKKLIDAGEVVGPRILPAGPMMSQTGGHFDYRLPNQVPDRAGLIDYWGRVGMNAIADGVPAVRQRAREAFMLGATQLKIAGGGGVASTYDPIDVRQYSFDEMQAAVDVAESYNSYVGAHIFTDDAVQMAVKAGVKSIEHGMLIGEDTLELMKENDVWLSIQPILNDEDADEFPNPESNRKFAEVTKGTDAIYRLAKEKGVKIAFGTDLFMSKEAAAKQGKFLAKLSRWFTPYEALKMATSDNAELMELSGPRHPYKEGPLGVIQEGAYADLILVDGNPLEDLNLVSDAEANFDLIMKDGKIYKNRLQ